MTTHLHRQIDLAVNRDGVIRRRDFLRGISAASIAAGALSWTDLVSLQAAELRRQGRACILLWMQGGPSQFETFSPKPGHANGGQTKAIATATAGIQIADNLPHLAKAMGDLAIIRSMTSKEGAHPRATFLLHTGYLPSPVVKYPAFGSIVAQQFENAAQELPAYVRIGNRGNLGATVSGGLLGSGFDPFLMGDATRPPENATLPTPPDRFQRRLGLLDKLEGAAGAGAREEVADHQRLYQNAARMILSPRMSTFDLSREPQSMRDAYGTGAFASGCLLARRLVEAGVPFVEVVSGGWDTHKDNFPVTKRLAGEIDQPCAQLIADLKSRGLLEKTLVVWMGEFGRTPLVNPNAGRDHYPRAFSVALAGGGVRGGRVIGESDAGGVEVVSRPVTVADLFQTFCKSLAIDPNFENMTSIGRPIKIVDGGKPVDELFG